ncbi:MAG: ATP-dependent 6-phosphofructokinase [Armatimonadetes bacterium]|nr:ATP-dependent 6-phosphofructokinase [Armatimonadota bacterium]
MSRLKKIGILTGGGDCPGLNAVIRAAVKTSHFRYGWQVIGVEDGFDGLIKPHKTRFLIQEDVVDILSKGGTILGTTNRGNPFSYKILKKGKIITCDYSETVIKKMRTLGIDALIIIGGEGTLKIALDFYRLGVPVVGVPKTIDNDLEATEVTFGFDSAINTAMEAIDKLRSTAESHHRVMVIEVMGRDAGWIALHAGIAGGADIILIPEISFDFNKIQQKIRQRGRQGYKYSIVVVAEGAYPKGGKVFTITPKNPLDNVRLGGIGYKIGEEISSLTGHETRVTVLGHLQRGGSPTANDRNLGTRFGAAAVRLIYQRQFGRMVCLKSGNIESVPLEEAIRQLKNVPLSHDLILTAKEMGIIFGD